MGLLGTMVVNFSANITGLTTGVAQAKSSLASVAAPAAVVAGAIIGIGVAGIAAGAKTVQMAGDFQSSMTLLQTGAGESADKIAMVSAGVLQMAVNTGTSTSQLAAGLYIIESAGQHGADGLKVLQAAAEGAKVGNADLSVVAKALSIEMTDYHMKASDAAEAMNGLTATVAAGNTNLTLLAPAMGSVLPIASKLGIAFPQVAGALATMTNAGVPARQAATNLASVLTNLSAPGAAAQKAMTGVGLSAQQVKDTLVNQGLPAALQLIEDHIGTKFPAGSVAAGTALKTIMGGLTGLKLDAETGGASLSILEKNINSVAAAMKNGGSSVTGWAAVQADFNQKMSQAQEVVETLGIKIGTALIPMAQSLIPVLGQVVTAATNVFNFFSKNQTALDILIGVIIALGGAIAGILVAALVACSMAAIAFLTPFLEFVPIFIAVGVGVALLVAGIVILVQHWNQVVAAFQNNAVFKTVLSFLQDLWSFIVAQFAPVWQELVTVWKTQLLPSLQQLWSALVMLKPVFELIGLAVAAVALIFVGLLVGAIEGVVKAFAALVSGLAQAFGGIVQIFTGIVQAAAGFFALLIDLFTGNFSKMGADWGMLWQGILNGVTGFGNVFMGLFGGFFLAVWGLLSGFVMGVLNFFNTLWNDLVGHSIIPDMINGIVSWFAQLPGRVGAIITQFVSSVISAITSFVTTMISWFIQLNVDAVQQVGALVAGAVNWISQLPGKIGAFISQLASGTLAQLSAWVSAAINWAVNLLNGIANQINQLPAKAAGIFNNMVSTCMNILNNMATAAFNAGMNIVKGIANGITNAIGYVANAIGSVVNYIAAHLPSSPAKMGPLKGLISSAALIPEQISQGILSNMSKLQGTMNKLPYPGSSSPAVLAGVAAASAAASSSAAGNQQPAQFSVYIDGKEATAIMGPHIANAMRGKGVRNR